MIYREEDINLDDVDSNYYKMQYITENFLDVTDLESSDNVIRKKHIMLDNDNMTMYIIYPSTNYLYLEDIKRYILELRNFMSSTYNVDIIKSNKIATEKVEIINIKWDTIESVYKETFQYTNLEILVCNGRKDDTEEE